MKLFIFTLGMIFCYSQEYIKQDGFEGVLFPKGTWNSFNFDKKNGFTPTKSDVISFELKVKDQYKDYVRQYYGFYENKKKLLGILLISHNMLPYKKKWKKEPLIVTGGGKSYRYIVYDIINEKVISNIEGNIE